MSEQLDIDAIEMRLLAATPKQGSNGYTNDRRVKRFVDALPVDIPAMIEEIRELREEVDNLNEAISDWEMLSSEPEPDER